jgi:hypothetical protein
VIKTAHRSTEHLLTWQRAEMNIRFTTGHHPLRGPLDTPLRAGGPLPRGSGQRPGATPPSVRLINLPRRSTVPNLVHRHRG